MRALVPVVLLAVVGLAALTRGEDRSRDRDTFVVAASGDAESVIEAMDPLLARRIDVVRTPDPSFAAAFGADVGLEIPEGAARRVADGDELEITLHVRMSDRSSRAAASLLETGISELERRQGASSAGAALYEVVDVQRTREGARSVYAQVAAALLALHAAMLAGSAGSRLAGRRHAPQTTAVMLLPLRRVDLARASALAETGLGLLTSLPIVAPVALGAVAFTVLESGWSTLAVTLVAVATASVALCASMVAIGTLIGLRVRSGEQVSLLSSAVVVAMAVLAGVVALGERPLPDAIALVPVAGVIAALRSALGDATAGSVVMLAVALVSTSCSSLLVLRAAARGRAADEMGSRAA